jgi:hypothetical protein
MAEESVIVIAAAFYVKLIMAVSCSNARKRKSNRNTCGEDEVATLQLHKKLSLRAKYWQLSELFSLNKQFLAGETAHTTHQSFCITLRICTSSFQINLIESISQKRCTTNVCAVQKQTGANSNTLQPKH